MDGKKQIKSKSEKSIIFIIAIIILAILGYAVWKQTDNKNNQKNERNSIKDQVELTEENLAGNWIRYENENRHEISFEAGGEMIYACFKPNDISPSTVSIRSSYSIMSNNTVSFNYTIDLEEYTEQYYASVSADELLLSPIEGKGERLRGTYKREENSTETIDNPTTGTNTSIESETEAAVSTEADEALTSEIETIPVTEPVIDNSWKSAYIDYISIQSDTDWTYMLIYLNNDNIPELYMQGMNLSLGGRICAYNAGYISPIQISAYGLSYIERGGLMLNSGGRQGDYYDQIFALENNDLVLKFNGSYGVDDNTLYFDESDYIYKYNNTVVSEAEYNAALNELFNKSYAIRCDAKYNKMQIISQINSMS